MRPTVTKGSMELRLSSPARGAGKTFMFNPNDITDTKGIIWATAEVPGASHPVYQFGSGGERTISFDIYLDGDRGHLKDRIGTRLSIKEDLYWYRSLIYPVEYSNSYKDVSPYVVIFSFGEMYQGLECIVKKADIKINYWTPQLDPVRAIVSMQLAEIVQRSQTADDFINLGFQ